jgi:predicted kinase
VRDVVVISGAPGAGKSTLAVPLAEALGFPLLSKDVIKEALFDALGHVEADESSSSRRLGGAAMELLWRLAAACPAVMIEANFRSSSEYERTRLTELARRPVEVYCRAPIDVVAKRYANRGAGTDHHPVHVARSLQPAAFEEFQQPYGLGPVIEVDTTEPIDVDDVVQRVRSALEENL